ncbi:hypothetical protein [Bradyrhizobium sp.]|uniref:hypothetical protein n=1 Tax=Bradyrhizobium sp. TaxID=376 RepID=UPI0039E2AC05
MSDPAGRRGDGCFGSKPAANRHSTELQQGIGDWSELTDPSETKSEMKKLLFGAAAASLLFAGPALAERIVIKDGHRHHHSQYRHHNPHRAYNQMHCRTVVVRDIRPSGRVVVRHVRRCF